MTEPVDPNPQMPVWQPQQEPELVAEPAPSFAPTYDVQAPASPYGVQQPTSAYGVQQPWSPFGEPPAQGFALALAPAPAAARNGKAVWAVVAGVAAAAVAAVAFLLVVHHDSSSSSSPTAALAAKSVNLPATFDGYSQIDSAAAQQVEATMRSLGSSDPTSKQLFAVASIGIYSTGTNNLPSLIAFTVPASKVPGAGTLSDAQVAQMAITGGVGAGIATPLTAGPHGGAVACGHATRNNMGETMCAWSDGKVVGMTLSLLPALPVAQLSQVQESLRDVIE